MGTMTEAIRLVISGDSKGAVKALGDVSGEAQKAQGTFGKYGEGLNKAANWAAAGVVALSAVIIKSVKDYADFAITVGKVSAQTGMGAEATSRFVGQLQFFHADASKAGMAVKTLEKGIYGLETGSQASVDAFKILGLTWEDLKNLKPEDQLALIRDRLSQVTDSAARSAAAGTLLGRGAKDMALWYTASAAAIDEVNKNLKANGQIMTAQDIEDAKKGAEAWKNFSGAMKGFEYATARGVLPVLTKLGYALTFITRTLHPIAGLLGYVAGALAVFVGVVKTAVFFQKTWNQLLGLLPARLVKAKVAEEGATVATRAGTGAMKAQMVTLGMYGIALAAAAVAIYGIVKAYQAWQQAAQQAATAAASAQATLDANASKLDPAFVAQQQAGINADKYQSPQGIGGWLVAALQGAYGPSWWEKSPLQMLPGFSSGGDFITRGATPIMVGEGGPERVTVTPVGRKGAGVTELHVHNHFHGPVVGGKAGMRELTEIVNRTIGKQVAGLTRGRMAPAYG